MSKIIIENRSKLHDVLAIGIVSQVIAGGRISDNGRQYCYYSTGIADSKPFGVASSRNKKSDRFIVVDQE